MKIGLPVDGTTLDANIEYRMSTAAYLMVVETDDLSIETLEAPQAFAGPGAGIKVLAGLIDMGAQVVMCGFVAPHVALSIEESGIEVVVNLDGTARDLIEQYLAGLKADKNADAEAGGLNKPTISEAAGKTARQFYYMLPVLTGVILLTGLIPVFLSKSFVLSAFSGNPFKDTFFGAVIGSLFVGNPINSYVIGQSLLELGGSLFGVCALMMTWVSVGLLQMPAEATALGKQFAIVRSIASFLVAILTSILVAMLMGAV